jgi:riboflavin transporter FmnP
MSKTKKLAVIAMLCAIAFLTVALVKIPVVPAPPLKYDPKDVIIVIGGFMFGPFAALSMAFIVPLIEMVTISESGIFGFLMNFISSAAFACTASVIYKFRRNIVGAVVGLISAWLITTTVMIAWNYLIIPLYLPFVTREAAAGMLIPIILPFNLLKGGLNASIALLAYKPIANALRMANVLPRAETSTGKKTVGKLNIGVMLGAAFALLTGILYLLAWRGII